jgi:hypothetical protein
MKNLPSTLALVLGVRPAEELLRSDGATFTVGHGRTPPPDPFGAATPMPPLGVGRGEYGRQAGHLDGGYRAEVVDPKGAMACDGDECEVHVRWVVAERDVPGGAKF